MSDPRRNFSWVVLLASLASAGDCRAHPTEPQAAFSLKDGWVEVTLRQDGRPVGNATIQILSEQGLKFGDGETGVEGQTAFPLPPGASFVVEIRTGAKTADPIQLYKSGAGVEPARVLLSYGLRPCCRSIKPQAETPVCEDHGEADEASDPLRAWHWIVPGLGGVAIAGAAWFLVRQRSGKLISGN